MVIKRNFSKKTEILVKNRNFAKKRISWLYYFRPNILETETDEDHNVKYLEAIKRTRMFTIIGIIAGIITIGIILGVATWFTFWHLIATPQE